MVAHQKGQIYNPGAHSRILKKISLDIGFNSRGGRIREGSNIPCCKLDHCAVQRGPKVTSLVAREHRATSVRCRLRFASDMHEIAPDSRRITPPIDSRRLTVALLDISLVVIFSGITL
jgi:hypothetical protein